MGGRGSLLSWPHPPSEQPWDYWLCGAAEGQWKALGHGEFCAAGEVTEKVPTGTYGGEPCKLFVGVYCSVISFGIWVIPKFI